MKVLRWFGIPLAVAMLAACGSSSKPAATTVPTTLAPATTTTLDPVAAKAAITSQWEGFFDGSTSMDSRLAKLESGQQLTSVLQGFSSQAATSTAKVTAITLLGDPDCTDNGVSAPCAKVTYDILVKGAVALPNSIGYAVDVNGTWLVSKSTFCTLAALGNGNKTPTGC